ncbi:uncharacterized protein [Atheta coriaria]|uniref:uncharacterized protein n=1 Tax=Dalotia coriaria TaxID=877792 RepID=UPI0031F46515
MHASTTNTNQLNKNALGINLRSDSQSVPNDLQLCGCYMREIQRNLNSQPRSLNMNIPINPSTKLSDILSKSPEKHEQNLAAWIEPRRLQLDKTLNKLYKSLPVSPVSEEKFDFEFNLEDEPQSSSLKKHSVNKKKTRKSFSYFLDIDNEHEVKSQSNDDNFRQICDDIEKFSQDFSRNYQAIEDIFNSGSSHRPKELFVNSGSGFQTLENSKAKTSEWISSQFGETVNDDPENGNFSSDSLEDCSFNSMRPCRKKHKKPQPPRRCVSNNELYNLTQNDDEKIDEKYLNVTMSKSYSQGQQGQGFYLNQSAYNSQESILSSEDNLLDRRTRSFCNSMESILSNESDCKSAPLECLFRDYDSMRRSKSCNYTLEVPVLASPTKCSKTVQTQTDFETPEEVVVKKSKSTEFQQRLLRFEQKKPVAYFLETNKESKKMEIPSMQFKNAQYKSKYCNVLNNKPECNEKQLMGNPQFALTTQNLPSSNNGNNNLNTNLSLKNKNKFQETASLDRHLLSKGLLESSEKICHKPPKAVRRHSSKTRRRSSATRTTYEYVKKKI